MTNFYNLLKNVCTLADEELPATFTDSSRPYPEIKIYLNQCLQEICSKFPWSFRERVLNIDLYENICQYTLPILISPQNILKNGLTISNNNNPLTYIHHTEIDLNTIVSDIPKYYSVFNNSLFLYPTPARNFNLSIKYLTSAFALDNENNEKYCLEYQDDKTIIPDIYLHTLEWGAYYLYRQNYRPDEKYHFAREKYYSLLLDMKKCDNCYPDSPPGIVLANINSVLPYNLG